MTGTIAYQVNGNPIRWGSLGERGRWGMYIHDSEGRERGKAIVEKSRREPGMYDWDVWDQWGDRLVAEGMDQNAQRAKAQAQALLLKKLRRFVR